MKKLMVGTLFSFLVVLSFVNAAECGGEVKCECSDTIVEGQVMWYDLENCLADGLVIGRSNISLDCDNHLIDGNSISSDYGVYIYGKKNVDIRNCEITDFSDGIGVFYGYYRNSLINNDIHDNGVGINLDTSSDHLVYDNKLNNNYQSGISLFPGSNNNLLSYNEVSNNNWGIYVLDSSDNTFNYNLIDNNIEYGIRLSGSNNIFSSNEITNNHQYGVYSIGSSYNTFWNNIFINDDTNAYEYENSYNYWNLSNVGNYWSDLVNNPSYPLYYEIDGEGNGIDWHPQRVLIRKHLFNNNSYVMWRSK